MKHNKVVVKYKDGTIKKGVIDNFFPEKTRFYLQTLQGEVEYIGMESLKAIYFVKDHEGNKDHDSTYSDIMPGEGMKIGVKFHDDETIIGYSLAYSPKRQGFMMTPADYRCNNTRIFVIQSAVKKVVVMYADDDESVFEHR